MTKPRTFEEWLVGRPAIIQEMARAYPPASWFWLTSDPEPRFSVYRVLSYNEHGTVTLRRFGIASARPMWDVFGVPPKKLLLAEPLPELAAALSDEQLAVYVLSEMQAVARMQMVIEDRKAKRGDKAAKKETMH